LPLSFFHCSESSHLSSPSIIASTSAFVLAALSNASEYAIASDIGFLIDGYLPQNSLFFSLIYSSFCTARGGVGGASLSSSGLTEIITQSASNLIASRTLTGILSG